MRESYFSAPACRKGASILLFGMSIFASCGALAIPSIEGVVVQGGGSSSSVVEIKGKSFGAKDKPYPILFDTVDRAYENGTLSAAFSKYAHGQDVTVTRAPSDPIWEKPSLGGTGMASTAKVWRDVDGLRGSHVTASYNLPTGQSFLGWPRAYGGSNTPVDNPKLYVSWWLKLKYDVRYYWQFKPSSLKGAFIPGELVELSTGYKGTFIGIQPDQPVMEQSGLSQFVFQDATNSTLIAGAEIKGVQSGATATIPTSGYMNAGSNKYIRIWEDPNGVEGMRFSWTQSQMGIGGTTPWYYAPITAGAWNHMEVYMDTKLGKVTTWTDNTLVGEMSLATAPAIDGKWSPTIGLLGIDGKQPMQQAYVSEIYMDNTPQRIVLGDASKWSDVKVAEVQLASEWADSKVVFTPVLGGLASSKTVYVYIFDENNNVNEEGVLLCDDCGVSKPESPALEVK